MNPDLERPISSDQTSPEKRLTLEELGLDPDTVKILRHRVILKENPTVDDARSFVEHYGRILFNNQEPDFYRVYGWVLHRLGTDLVNFSYLVTTPEGAKFAEAYQYLHQAKGMLFAHAKSIGNAFMVFGGEQYISQFPNEYHLGFIQKILTSPLNTEEGITSLFGGTLDSQFVHAATGYVNKLAEVSETLNPANVALSHLLSPHGISLPGSWFLNDISPRGADDREPTRPIAQIYRKNVPQVRKTLLTAGQRLANPSFLIEHLLGGYFANAKNLSYDYFYRVAELIHTLRAATGDQWHYYRYLLLTRISELEGQKKPVPTRVMEAVNFQGSRL